MRRLTLAAGFIALSAQAAPEPTQVVPLADGDTPAARSPSGITDTTPPPVIPAQPDAAPVAAVQLGPVSVKGVRKPITVGVLPGLDLSRDQIPSAIQSATAKDIRESGALNLTDFLNTQLQSVNVNDFQGNPFQVDVSFRGFTAGPQIGTPQGLSVFFGGTRVNEPFGDVVNWDLIPLFAIERLDLFPGSNPVFGLNTLGGAIALKTKSGFTAPGLSTKASGGSFGRRQAEAAIGGSVGDLAGYAGLFYFAEDGWRDNSASEVRQAFARGDWNFSGGTVALSALLADNDLIGNGLIPVEQLAADRDSVFTSPDQTRNRLNQFNLSGQFEVSRVFNVTAQGYRRDSRRRGVNGDVYGEFDDIGPSSPLGNRFVRNPEDEICRYADVDDDGRPDTLSDGTTQAAPLNDPFRAGLCENVQYGGTPRNGAYVTENGEFGVGPGVATGTPNALLTRTNIGQVTYGGAVQLNWNFEQHKFLFGASVDSSRADYSARQQLGLIDAGRRVFVDPANVDPLFRAAQIAIPINDFNGTSRTLSAYFSETFSPRDNLHLTLAGRYNFTQVRNQVDARIGVDLHELVNRLPTAILCPEADLASCPDSLPPIRINDLSNETLAPTREKFIFRSLNPSFGFNWLPVKSLNLFGNISLGSRAPSVIELGCAFDATPVVTVPGFTDPATGQDVPPQTAPRSLVGPTCSLPTSLSGDPFLPQIRSRSAELGARGTVLGGLQWNLSVYRTDLQDDIYFVGVSASRSYFDTIDKTRRQGLESGLKGRWRFLEYKLGYAYTAATFESEFYVLSPHNASADFNRNNSFGGSGPQAGLNNGLGTFRTVRVEPGAILPASPLHNINLNLDFKLTKALSFGVTTVFHSKSFVRGNENNAHQASGSDQVTDGFGPVQGIGSFNGGRPFATQGAVPEYAVVNVDAAWRFRTHFTAFVQVLNVLDQDYASAGRLGVNPFATGPNGAIGPGGYNYNSIEHRNTTFLGPGAPRGVFAGLAYDFDFASE